MASLLLFPSDLCRYESCDSQSVKHRNSLLLEAGLSCSIKEIVAKEEIPFCFSSCLPALDIMCEDAITGAPHLEPGRETNVEHHKMER